MGFIKIKQICCSTSHRITERWRRRRSESKRPWRGKIWKFADFIGKWGERKDLETDFTVNPYHLLVFFKSSPPPHLVVLHTARRNLLRPWMWSNICWFTLKFHGGIKTHLHCKYYIEHEQINHICSCLRNSTFIEANWEKGFKCMPSLFKRSMSEIAVIKNVKREKVEVTEGLRGKWCYLSRVANRFLRRLFFYALNVEFFLSLQLLCSKK